MHKSLHKSLHIGLNLLFIIPGQNGGTQVYSESLIRALAALDQDDKFTVFVSEEGRTLEMPDQGNFQKVVCPVRATRREVRYVYEQLAFPCLLRHYHLDLLHSLGYVGPLFPPCPQVVTIHDVNFLAIRSAMTSIRQTVLNQMVPLVARRSAHILAVSQFSKEQIEQHLHVPPARISVTHEGPRETEALPASSWEEITARYQIRQPYLMAFGSLSGHKNIDRLIRAFAGIQKEVPHTLLLVGHMIPGADLQAEIAALGIGERIKITGYVPDAHVMPLLEHAELFVFPSLYEGFGLPVLEGQMAGVAVACSTAASLPEVAGDGAAFFDPTSVDEMQAVLRDCLRDHALRDRLVTLGSANAKRFSWEQTARQTLAVYRQVMKQK